MVYFLTASAWQKVGRESMNLSFLKTLPCPQKSPGTQLGAASVAELFDF